MRIHAIQTGTVKIKTAQVEGRGHGFRRQMAVYTDGNWTEWLPTYAWAIEHPEGIIVVDTGQGVHFKLKKKRRSVRNCAPSASPDNRLAWVNFHSFRHTWATWMRRYGGLDTGGLVATRNWRDERSASRYAHAVTSEEWDAVERLPAVGNLRGVTR
jgi:hypothetical protein